MGLLEPVEYPLYLNTGEVIEVLELDEGRVDALQSREIKDYLRRLLALCNHVTRLAVDEAKRGYSDKLENQLRTPPEAALLKIDEPRCSQFKLCPMSKSDCITTRIIGKKKSLPICWEYLVGNDITGFAHVAAVDLARNIVHAWGNNRYVLIITG